MMVSPHYVYNELKTKSDKEVLAEIRRFRREISYAKKELASPITEDMILSPCPETRISMNREYIDAAKRILFERGIEYKPTRAEQRSEEFNDCLSDLMEIIVIREGYFIGRNQYIVICGNRNQVVHYENRRRTDDGASKSWIIERDLKSFVSDLEDLYIGEWKKYYYADALDGEQWEIMFVFADGAMSKFTGSNAYPYNFDMLMGILGIDDEY